MEADRIGSLCTGDETGDSGDFAIAGVSLEDAESITRDRLVNSAIECLLEINKAFLGHGTAPGALRVLSVEIKQPYPNADVRDCGGVRQILFLTSAR